MAVGARLPGKVVYRGRNVVVSYESHMRDWAKIAMNPTLEATAMHIAANSALPYAISISPVDSGHYARSWAVEPSTWVNTETKLRRVVALLINRESYYSTVIEWGKEKVPAQHVLRRTLEHLTSTLGAT